MPTERELSTKKKKETISPESVQWEQNAHSYTAETSQSIDLNYK